MKIIRLLVTLSSSVLLTSLLFQPSFVSYADSLEGKKCSTYKIPVSLAPDLPKEYNVVGKLCSKESLEGKTLQVLVHGFTMGKSYWDLPYQPEKYSYVNRQIQAGYVTFSLDRIGVGESDHPPGSKITVDSNAYVVQQVIEQLRSGMGGVKFSKLILVGHSLGSIISVAVAKNVDVDGLILTGMLHDMDPETVEYEVSHSQPANLDPKFKDENLPPDYLSIQYPARKKLFFYNADPALLELDDKELRQTGTTGELSTFGEYNDPNFAQGIDTPIFLVVGDKDPLLCNEQLPCTDGATIVNREKEYFSNPDTLLEGYVVKNASHNLTYERNAPDFFQAVLDWVNRKVGPKVK
ncbi:alpha/beta hydrolase [Alkalihalobacillus sp. TS-13]|uniref:alpha/beta hydrolase n=1 Tax=Alkalihalobacillus sp. TS-13 TaxID=2842455 RepID=UPI001C86A966|nr:alpha/beta hydrolase [Alkalihalobacillus sp. TS-13]